MQRNLVNMVSALRYIDCIVERVSLVVWSNVSRCPVPKGGANAVNLYAVVETDVDDM